MVLGVVWFGNSHQVIIFFVVVYVHKFIRKINQKNVQVSSPNASFVCSDILHILPNIKREKKKACARDKNLIRTFLIFHPILREKKL